MPRRPLEECPLPRLLLQANFTQVGVDRRILPGKRPPDLGIEIRTPLWKLRNSGIHIIEDRPVDVFWSQSEELAHRAFVSPPFFVIRTPVFPRISQWARIVSAVLIGSFQIPYSTTVTRISSLLFLLTLWNSLSKQSKPACIICQFDVLLTVNYSAHSLSVAHGPPLSYTRFSSLSSWTGLS